MPNGIEKSKFDEYCEKYGPTHGIDAKEKALMDQRLKELIGKGYKFAYCGDKFEELKTEPDLFKDYLTNEINIWMDGAWQHLVAVIRSCPCPRPCVCGTMYVCYQNRPAHGKEEDGIISDGCECCSDTCT